MKLPRLTIALSLLLATALLAGCNFPGQATPSPIIRYITATFTISPTPPPPTATNTPEPTITLAPLIPSPVSLEPSPTFGPPPTIPPPTLAATPTSILPTAGALFSATFEGGTFTFRTNSKGNSVTLKVINLKKAVCQTGYRVTNQLTFEDVTYFPIDNSQFVMKYDRAYITGRFSAPTQANGSLTVYIINDQCRIGPVSWTAYAQ